MASDSSTRHVRIVVVDDHPLFRDGICQTIEAEADFDLIGQFDDGAKGLKALRHLQPDIALLDVNLPTMNGLEVLKFLREENLETRVVVLTAHHDAEQTVHVIRTGAQAYAEKNIQPHLLVQIVRAVADGQYVIHGTKMNEEQVQAWLHEQIEDLAGPYALNREEHYIPLSRREMEILKFVTHGMSNQEVANELNISQQTVKNHMTSILRKLNVKDRTQAAVAAIRRGWVRIQK